MEERKQRQNTNGKKNAPCSVHITTNDLRDRPLKSRRVLFRFFDDVYRNIPD